MEHLVENFEIAPTFEPTEGNRNQLPPAKFVRRGRGPLSYSVPFQGTPPKWTSVDTISVPCSSAGVIFGV